MKNTVAWDCSQCEITCSVYVRVNDPSDVPVPKVCIMNWPDKAKWTWR